MWTQVNVTMLKILKLVFFLHLAFSPSVYIATEDTSDSLFAPSLSISQCVTLKLSSSNYLLLKTQFESFLSSQFLLGFVNGSTPRPAPTTSTRDGDVVTEVANPEFVRQGSCYTSVYERAGYYLRHSDTANWRTIHLLCYLYSTRKDSTLGGFKRNSGSIRASGSTLGSDG